MLPFKNRHANGWAVFAVAAIVAAVGGILAAMIAFGIVHDLGTAGSLFSVMAVPIAVAIFYAARLLHWGDAAGAAGGLAGRGPQGQGACGGDGKPLPAPCHRSIKERQVGSGNEECRPCRHIATHVISIRSRYS